MGDRSSTPRALQALEARLGGPEGLTQRVSTFTRRDVLRAYAEAHPHGAPLARQEELADRFLARRAVLLESALRIAGRAVYTTPELLRAEERLLDLAAERDVWLPLPAESVTRALAAHPDLGADQQAAVRHLASGDGRVRLLEAHAGRGKTAALGALAEAHARAGDPVLGTAWQGEAAQTLHREAGVPAETAARLLHRLARDPEALPADACSSWTRRPRCPPGRWPSSWSTSPPADAWCWSATAPSSRPSTPAGPSPPWPTGWARPLHREPSPAGSVQRAVADALAEARPREALDLLTAHGGLHLRRPPRRPAPS